MVTDDDVTLDDVGDTLSDDVGDDPVVRERVISNSSGEAECELTNCTCSLLCRRSSGDSLPEDDFNCMRPALVTKGSGDTECEERPSRSPPTRWWTAAEEEVEEEEKIISPELSDVDMLSWPW